LLESDVPFQHKYGYIRDDIGRILVLYNFNIVGIDVRDFQKYIV